MQRLFVLAPVSLLLLLAPGARAAAPVLDVYAGEVSAAQLERIVALGVDRHELQVTPLPGVRGAKGDVRVEAILSARQAGRLRDDGVELAPKQVDGESVAARATALAAEPGGVFRPYSGANGLKAEFERTAKANPSIAKLVTYGKTVRGQDIVALKLTRDARRSGDGRKPAVLYLAAQHAREWITPEMVRRLMLRLIDRYNAGDQTIRRLLTENELWFVPVANPDGYDFTFEPGQRLWRKNLRDNNDDRKITAGDGVDLNRNYPTRWGYDNEGSSPDTTSETYRGPSPGSEPETKALDAFMQRIGFAFLVNYHSAAELILYGTGWQVATPTPDDLISVALAGDDAKPAVPGSDPDLSAELYTTNGDTDTHMTERYGTLGFTPEMSTCEDGSASDPDDAWLPADCGSVFEFPDDEQLIEREFEKNIPFALSVAKSAKDPDDPVSSVGRRAPDFDVDSFSVSYGDPQTVAVTAKRALRGVRLWYRINGGLPRATTVTPWSGGSRYGDENDRYYAELRGTVRGARPGDRVDVWFSALHPQKGLAQSKRFTYRLQQSTGAKVLVLADEDYTGVNPTSPPGTNAPKYAAQYVAALRAAGYRADVWDTDKQGVPHDLGVLGHYDAVVWYLGDNRITQEADDELVSTPLGDLPDIGVAQREQDLTMAVRDYLNAGGKLIHAGETAQTSGLPGVADAVGGLYYGLNGDPSKPCVISSQAGFFEDCLILADDFRQYWLGAFSRTDVPGPASVTGTGAPLTGYDAQFGGRVAGEGGDNPLDEAGNFRLTRDVLDPARFPQFDARVAAEFPLEAGSPLAPIEGTRYAGALHADASYMRLTKTIDLTGKTSAELAFALSYDTERGYDHVIVEARTPGGDDWTTLPEKTGLTGTTPPSECEAGGFLLELHPFLTRYLGGADCTQGEWNSFTGVSDAWTPVAFDLSAYAGKQVEVSISYVTDPGTGRQGAFVDDTKITADGQVISADGFEGPTSTWRPGGPPEGGPPNGGDWQIGERLLDFTAGVATDHSLLLGFGLEQLDSDATRADLLRRALTGLGVGAQSVPVASASAARR